MVAIGETITLPLKLSSGPCIPVKPFRNVTLGAVIDHQKLFDYNSHLILTKEGITMKTAAVSELKATLSEYLTCVKAGEEVIVTERGKPIAKIVPLSREGSVDSPHLLDLERAGLIRLGSGALPQKFWKMQRPCDKDGAALTSLLRERKEGR